MQANDPTRDSFEFLARDSSVRPPLTDDRGQSPLRVASPGHATRAEARSESLCGVSRAQGSRASFVKGRARAPDLWPTAPLVLVLAIAAAVPVRAAVPANDECRNAIVIPDTGATYHPPPLDVTAANVDTCEALEGCEYNGVGTTHSVWFSFTPQCDGLASLNTYGITTSATNYDTVLSVWDRCGAQVGSVCNAPVEIACNDDDPAGGTLTSRLAYVPMTHGISYKIKVSKYGAALGGGPYVLDFVFDFTPTNAGPPIAQITAPAALGCACDATTIRGSAYAAGTPFALLHRMLEYQPAGGGPWTPISDVTGPAVVVGDLAVWNTAAPPLPQGFYFLRLTVENTCGISANAVAFVWVDKRFDSASVRGPLDGDVLRTTACIDGTMWDQSCFDHYTVRYRPAAGGAYQPVDPTHPTYTASVITDPLASWNTTLVPDGDYLLEAAGHDTCGHTVTIVRSVRVDNTPPTAVITSPMPCRYVNGVVTISGTVNDANLGNWVLQVTGGISNTWTNIASDTAPRSGVLGTWNTAGLPRCPYTIRLVAEDRAAQPCNGIVHNRTEYTISVDVGVCCDVNRDGVGDGLDVQPFVNCLMGAGSCP